MPRRPGTTTLAVMPSPPTSPARVLDHPTSVLRSALDRPSPGIGATTPELVEVMIRMTDLGQDLATAVSSARVHPNEDGLQVEPHIEDWMLAGLDEIDELLGPVNVWPAPNPFFGGVNAVHRAADGSVIAVADGRRGGSAAVVPPR